MTDVQTYTIRRAAGGASHFARVTVAIRSPCEGDVTESRGENILPTWEKAASAGVKYALGKLGIDAHVRFLAIDGTLADTREDTVYTAAALATFRLLGDDGHVEQFDGDRWRPVECK